MSFTNNRYIVKSPYEYGTLSSSTVGNAHFVRVCSTVSNTTVTLKNAAGDTIGSVLIGNEGDTIVIQKDIDETLSTNQNVYATGEGAGVLPPSGGDAAGLYRTIYDGYFNDDTTFFATAPVLSAAVNLSPVSDGDPGVEPFSTQLLGYFKPVTTETYTFYLTSDDASFMWLGATAITGFNTGNALIDNGGVHGSVEVSAAVALTAGVYYPIRIQMGDNSGGDVLDLEYSTPTISKTNNVTGLIFYNSTTNGL